jgi:protein TonB
VAVQVSPEGRHPADGSIRAGELGVSPPAKVRHVAPVYPALARAANVQGIVIMEARIEQDGSVGDAKVIKSIPLLDQAALDAVKQWRFTPTLLNGQPVAVTMTLTINFALGENTPSAERQEQASTDKAGPEPYLSPDRSKVVDVGSGKPVR